MPANGDMYLHASGREDVDVRMLGTGRPFVFELMNPKRTLSASKIMDSLKVNGPYVYCSEFKIVDKQFFDKMKDMESKKAKSYAAVVHSNTVLT